MKRRRLALPLRLWLVLVVAATAAGITAAEINLAGVMVTWQVHADQSREAVLRRLIGTDAALWSEPAWQRNAEKTLAALGVEAEILRVSPGSPDRLVYVTSAARTFLDTRPAALLGSTGGPLNGQEVDLTGDPASGIAHTFEKMAIVTRASASNPRPVPIGAVFVWYTRPAPGSPSRWLWPLAALVAVVLVLTAAIVLLVRSVLRPLAAMNRAVEDIAGGDLEVHLPPSRAREVASIGAALEGMSVALRESLGRQTVLEEERKLFIGAIVHDLRTPLFMLRGYLKGLESGVAATPEKQAHYIAACRAKADALERLVADLFDYTRLEYLRQEPECAPLDLGVLLHETVEGLLPLAEAKGVALTLDAPTEPCLVLGDAPLLARVVGNLLDNALRHTPVGGKICLRWRREEKSVVFAVADTGSGIAAHDLPHLFAPLYRGERSRNRQTGGAGLGLTIAQRIMQAHGGDLTAANTTEGGALFTASLPAGPLPAGPLPAGPLPVGADPAPVGAKFVGEVDAVGHDARAVIVDHHDVAVLAALDDARRPG